MTTSKDKKTSITKNLPKKEKGILFQGRIYDEDLDRRFRQKLRDRGVKNNDFIEAAARTYLEEE